MIAIAKYDKSKQKINKFNIKFLEDWIYEETIKQYGKSHAKNRCKTDRVDEYLKEEKEMF